MAKIRTIELSELTPVKTPRKLSARQVALQKREAVYEQAINKLHEPGKALVFEPTDEKLPTLRASIARVILRSERAAQLHFAVIGGVAVVALSPIPGSRRARSKTPRPAETSGSAE